MAKKALTIFLLTIATSVLYGQNGSYFLYKAKAELNKHEWILLLPGSSGLTIFEDSTFYNRKAEILTQKGYDVLLLDYKSFYKSSSKQPKGSTGEKISWVVRQAIEMAKDKQQINLTDSGHIIGWSLAGEGVFNLLKDTNFVNSNKIKSVALYYPSNNEKIEISTTIPLLIQIGESDKTVVADKLQSQIKSNEMITFIVYPNSFHGFDIETLTKPKIIKFPPVVGKKHTFFYNKEATEKANIALAKFLGYD